MLDDICNVYKFYESCVYYICIRLLLFYTCFEDARKFY